MEGSPEHSDDLADTTGLDLDSLWKLVETDAPEQRPDPLVGLSLGDVTLVRLIAEGGMGRVYEAVQDSPRRHVAVKVLRPGVLSRTSIRRFLAEAEILGQLRHPWVMQVFSAGTFGIAGTQLPYFVMELIPEALPITAYVRDRRLPVRDRLELFGHVCDAVAHAHARGVIHRDLKPNNLLVDPAGRPKVIDFGIARGGTEPVESITMTGTGQLLGTLQYMSPEQVDGRGAIDARSDVYSLGVILHELVADRLPYDVAREPIIEAARIIRERKPAMVDTGGSGVPPGLALTIDRALQKDASRRFPDAAALADAIRQALTGGGVRGRLAMNARLLAHRLGNLPRLSVVAIAAVPVAMILAAVFLTTAPALRGPSTTTAAAIIVPPSPALATTVFRHAFTSVLEAEADRFLVEASGMRKWDDPREEPRVTYWGPDTEGAEGRLCYCVTFPGRTARIRLDAESQCWDFLKHPGGIGRGASAIEASRDGTTWVTLRDNVTHRSWGASWEIHEDLPAALLGTDALWLRLRFLTESADHDRGYTVAQFARGVTGKNENVFAIEADCVPPDDRP